MLMKLTSELIWAERTSDGPDAKNALFAGHKIGTENWAMLASLIANCKISDVDAVSDLTDTLRALLDGRPKSRMSWNFDPASSLNAWVPG